MRLAAGLLFVALTGSIALADDAKPAETQPAPAPAVKAPKVPLRVVRVLAETHQALLFDKNKGTHVLADVGKTIDGFTVDDIDDDTVTLSAENGAQIVLAAPDPSWRRHHADGDDEAHPARPARRAKDAPAKDAAKDGPLDPYGAAPMTGPEDPYGEAPVRAVEAPGAPTVNAPIEAGEGGVRTAEAPAKSAAPTAPASTEVRVVEAPKAPDPTADALAAAITAPPGAIVVARTDVNAALGNFAALASSIRGSFTPTGAKLDSVATGSLFAKAGLRAGDTIVAVDNHPLHSIDDAADVYARSSAAKLVTLQIIRANKPMTLRVSIQ
jgi:membrane-associated protease RseP (regulator of RpoE activity)